MRTRVDESDNYSVASTNALLTETIDRSNYVKHAFCFRTIISVTHRRHMKQITLIHTNIYHNVLGIFSNFSRRT